MIKELDTVKKLLEEEYAAYNEQLSSLKILLDDQEKKIKEQERFIAVLEREREKKTEVLSAYNNDEAVSDRIKEEENKKQNIQNEYLENKQKVQELSLKVERYKDVINQLTSVNKENTVLMDKLKMDEINDSYQEILKNYADGLKKIGKVVDEYIYMDPDRVKVEVQKYITESKNAVKQFKKNTKGKMQGLIKICFKRELQKFSYK